jgi:hypothetical protein
MGFGLAKGVSFLFLSFLLGFLFENSISIAKWRGEFFVQGSRSRAVVANGNEW